MGGAFCASAPSAPFDPAATHPQGARKLRDGVWEHGRAVGGLFCDSSANPDSGCHVRCSELSGSTRSSQEIVLPHSIISSAVRKSIDEGSDFPGICPWQFGSIERSPASRESWGSGFGPTPPPRLSAGQLRYSAGIGTPKRQSAWHCELDRSGWHTFRVAVAQWSEAERRHRCGAQRTGASLRSSPRHPTSARSVGAKGWALNVQNGENEPNRFRVITFDAIESCVMASGNWGGKSNPIEAGSSGGWLWRIGAKRTMPQVRGSANWGFPSVQPQPPGHWNLLSAHCRR
jgi:hypothetical protein